jgi:hypothetical protein
MATSAFPVARVSCQEGNSRSFVRVRHEGVAETVLLFRKGGDNTRCSASGLLPRRASLATGGCGALGTT